MSMVRKFAAAGQSATAPFEEETVINLRTGRRFRAKCVPMEDLALVGEITKDIREHTKIHIRDRAAAAEILPDDPLEFLGATHFVLKDSRSDNPASLHIEFECAKIVPGTDQQ